FETLLDMFSSPRRNIVISVFTAWMCASDGASGPFPNSSRLNGCRAAACLVKFNACAAVHAFITSPASIAGVPGVWTWGEAAASLSRGRISEAVAMGLPRQTPARTATRRAPDIHDHLRSSRDPVRVAVQGT